LFPGIKAKPRRDLSRIAINRFFPYYQVLIGVSLSNQYFLDFFPVPFRDSSGPSAYYYFLPHPQQSVARKLLRAGPFNQPKLVSRLSTLPSRGFSPHSNVGFTPDSGAPKVPRDLFRSDSYDGTPRKFVFDPARHASGRAKFSIGDPPANPVLDRVPMKIRESPSEDPPQTPINHLCSRLPVALRRASLLPNRARTAAFNKREQLVGVRGGTRMVPPRSFRPSRQRLVLVELRRVFVSG